MDIVFCNEQEAQALCKVGARTAWLLDEPCCA